MRSKRIGWQMFVVAFAIGGALPISVMAASENAVSWPSRAPWAEHPDVYRVVTQVTSEYPGGRMAVLPLKEATPEAFLAMLSQGEIMPIYDAARLRMFVDQYNLNQYKRFGMEPIKISPDDFGDGIDHRPQGHTQLEFADWGKHFVVYVEKVEETHTDVLDGGRDSYASAFFTKNPVEQVLELPGPTYPMFEPDMVLSIPESYSCMGHTPEGGLSVHDLRSEFVFEASFPKGTYSVVVDSSTGSDIRLIATSEEISPNRERHSCETSEWVRNVRTTFSLKCSRAKQQCTLKRVDRKVEEGCRDVGQCE